MTGQMGVELLVSWKNWPFILASQKVDLKLSLVRGTNSKSQIPNKFKIPNSKEGSQRRPDALVSKRDGVQSLRIDLFSGDSEAGLFEFQHIP